MSSHGRLKRLSSCCIVNDKSLYGIINVNTEGESTSFVDLHVVLLLVPLFPDFFPVGLSVLTFLPRVSAMFGNKQELPQLITIEEWVWKHTVSYFGEERAECIERNGADTWINWRDGGFHE